MFFGVDTARSRVLWYVQRCRQEGFQGMKAKAERMLAEEFKKAINYPLLVPNNLSEAGWPDRFIQLPNSRIVACEFKVVSLLRNDTFTLPEFRQTQAAWMAKWQRNDGLGFLLVGLNKDNGFIGYVVIKCAMWKDWLTVNVQRYDIKKVGVMTHIDNVMDWFEEFIPAQVARYNLCDY